MIHLLSDIEEPRCDCVQGEDGGTKFIEDATCPACLRVYLEGEIIRVSYEAHQEVQECKAQVRELKNQVQLLLRAVVDSALSESKWSGSFLDLSSYNSAGNHPWQKVTLYCDVAHSTLAELDDPESQSWEITEDSPGVYGVSIVTAQDLVVEEPPRAPTLYDHLLG